MTIKKQIGQFFVLGFDGLELTKDMKNLIHEYHIGSIILFSRNIKNSEQLKKLTTSIQFEAQQAGYIYPILICLDQENGIVRRITEGITLFPGAMSIAATQCPENAYKVSLASGKELASCGINWNLAPVADVNNNSKNPIIGVRSFGDKPNIVSEYVKSSVKGFKKSGVLSCLKHFPGHGDTSIDSHLGVPVILKNLEALENLELIPFKAGIEAGCETIMISHIVFQKLEEKPASISKVMIQDILREKLNYHGVVTTDCMEMEAIKKTIGVKEGCYQAFQAGSDLLMISHSIDEQLLALNYFEEKIMNDEISKERVANSIQRIQKIRSLYSFTTEPNLRETEKKNHQELASRLYEDSFTVLKKVDSSSILDKKVLILFPDEKTLLRVEDVKQAYLFDELFEKVGKERKIVLYDKEGICNEKESFESLLKEYELLIVCSVNVEDADWIVSQTKSVQLPVHHIVMKNPYDHHYMTFNQLQSTYFSYEPTNFVLKKLIELICDNKKMNGKLPISLL